MASVRLRGVVRTLWNPAHRRHPFWRPLETWSRINNGLPKATYAHHVIYLTLVGYTQVMAPMNWRELILRVLESDPI